MCPDCDELSRAPACGNPNFHCSPADGHGHPHFTELRALRALRRGRPERGAHRREVRLLPRGHDLRRRQRPRSSTASFQGLTAGCEDLYSRFLGCQYIDVTGLAAGDYMLRVTADPEAKISETRRDQQRERVPVSIEGTEPSPTRRCPAPRSSSKATSRRHARSSCSRRPEADFALPSPPVAPTVERRDAHRRGPEARRRSAPGLRAARPRAGRGSGIAAGREGLPLPGRRGRRRAGARSSRPTRLSARCSGAALALPAAGAARRSVFTSSATKRYCATLRRHREAQRRREAEAREGAARGLPGALSRSSGAAPVGPRPWLVRLAQHARARLLPAHRDRRRRARAAERTAPGRRQPPQQPRRPGAGAGASCRGRRASSRRARSGRCPACACCWTPPRRSRSTAGRTKARTPRRNEETFAALPRGCSRRAARSPSFRRASATTRRASRA